MASGFDANIILQGMQRGPSAFDTMQQLQGMQQARQQHETTLANLLMKQNQERAQADIYRQHADNQEGLSAALMRGGFGPQGLEVAGAQSEIGRRKASEQSEIAKMLKGYQEQVSNLLYGTKDQADYEARLSTVSPQQRSMFPSSWDEARPLVESIAIPAEKRAQMAHQGEQLKETKRHNEAMEKRPSSGMMPVFLQGEGGFYEVPRTGGAPATPVLDASGKQVAKPSAGAKPLNKGDMDRLEELRASKDAFSELGRTFKRDFAGGGPAGTASVALGSAMGSLASKGAQEKAEWWADFARYIDLPERNKTFGASLSAGEKASWESAKNIKPGNDPDLVEKQVKKMEAIFDAVAKRRGRALAKGGFSLESIEEYTGPLGEEAKPAKRPRGTKAPAPANSGLTPEEQAELDALEKKYGGAK